MKYMSEILNKSFDSAEECVAAEEKFLADLKKKEESDKEAEISLAKQKKEFVSKIEALDSDIDAAITAYNNAKEKAAKILEESNNQVEEILNAAKKDVADAKKAKFDMIAEFNKKFGGPYTVRYTGERAEQEFKKAEREFNSLFNNLFKFIF